MDKETLAPPRAQRRRAPDIAKDAEAIRLYNAGVAPVDIARLMGVSRVTISRRLKRIRAAQAAGEGA